ncbi:MAG: transposase [Alphaproteobacteria bacterium]|nr:transposase [Alphaproteobacteria bacterium]
MPTTSRMAMVDEGFVNLSLRNQLGLLDLNRSSYYYQPKPSHLNERLGDLIEQIWQRFPFLGYRKITAIIVNQGLGVNRKRVQSLMQKLDLQAIKPKKRKNIKASKPHKTYQVWSTDITYIPMP